jgi:hypothetical protein
VLYTVAIPIAFLNAYVCLAFHGLLALYYAFDPVSRSVGRRIAMADDA